MQLTQILILSILTPLLSSYVNGFGIPLKRGSNSKVRLFNAEALTEDAIECYLVNQEAVIEEGEDPRVICTSDPKETAWMEGINEEDMIKTEGLEIMEGQCVEGHSVTGKPEWECEV